jgi:hypothetical protein
MSTQDQELFNDITSLRTTSSDASANFLRLAESRIDQHIVGNIGSRDAHEGMFFMARPNGRELHVLEPNPGAAASESSLEVKRCFPQTSSPSLK